MNVKASRASIHASDRHLQHAALKMHVRERSNTCTASQIADPAIPAGCRDVCDTQVQVSPCCNVEIASSAILRLRSGRLLATLAAMRSSAGVTIRRQRFW